MKKPIMSNNHHHSHQHGIDFSYDPILRRQRQNPEEILKTMA